MSVGDLDTVGSPAFTDEESARYRAAGWWSDVTLSDAVRGNAEQRLGHAAYVDYPGWSFTWREFDDAATALAEQLAGVGVVRGDRIAVWHGDSQLSTCFSSPSNAAAPSLSALARVPAHARSLRYCTTRDRRC